MVLVALTNNVPMYLCQSKKTENTRKFLTKFFSSASCDIFLLGVTCKEAQSTADSCIQGTCFNNLDKTVCESDSQVCLSGHCVNYRTYPTSAIPLNAASSVVVKVEISSSSCENITVSDTSNVVRSLFRMSLAPTELLNQYSGNGLTSVTLCPSGSSWFIHISNPSESSTFVSFSRNSVTITDSEKEVSSNSSKLIFFAMLNVFAIMIALLL